MAGKDCVGIAADTRLGVQAQTVACDFKKVFKMGDKLFVGLAGLASDVQTLEQLLTFRKNLYELKEEREMKPKVRAGRMSEGQEERSENAHLETHLELFRLSY